MKVKKPRGFKYKRLGEETIPTLARLRPHQNVMLKEMATKEKESEAEIIRASIEFKYKNLYPRLYKKVIQNVATK